MVGSAVRVEQHVPVDPSRRACKEISDDRVRIALAARPHSMPHPLRMAQALVDEPRLLVRRLGAEEDLTWVCGRRALQPFKVVARVPVVGDACCVRCGGAVLAEEC